MIVAHHHLLKALAGAGAGTSVRAREAAWCKRALDVCIESSKLDQDSRLIKPGHFPRMCRFVNGKDPSFGSLVCLRETMND